MREREIERPRRGNKPEKRVLTKRKRRESERKKERVRVREREREREREISRAWKGYKVKKKEQIRTHRYRERLPI